MERDYSLEVIKSSCYMRMQALRGGGGMMLPIFNLSTSRGRVVNTKTQPLYPTAKALPYPFYRRLGGPHRQSGGEQRGENLSPPPGFKTGPSIP